MKRGIQVLFALLVLLAIASFGVPYLGGNQFKPTVEARLSESLGRNVEIRGEVRFQFWPHPGFSAFDVVIDELSAYGVEPFAYVGELDVAMALGGLLQGRLDPVQLTLGPSDEKDVNVNLVRADAAGWNFQPLLTSALAQRGPLPGIRVQGGRINVKFGDTKSILYLAETELFVEAEPDSGRIQVRFEGEPARTDRPARAFGTLSGRGWIKAGGAEGGTGDMRVAIQRMAISEIMTLANGTSSGLGGFLSSTAHLTGPLQSMAIDGSVQLEDLGRLSNLFSSAPKWILEFGGAIDGPGRSMKIETRSSQGVPLPLSARLRVTEWQTTPRWGVLMTLRDLPFASLRTIASATGATFPTQLPIAGNLSGALGYSPSGGLKGMLNLSGGKVVLPNDVSYPVESASVVVDGSKFQLHPSVVQMPKGPLKMEASYEMVSGDTDARMEVPQMDVAEFRGLWDHVVGSELPPLIAQLENGRWRGALRYQEKEDKRVWLGDATIESGSVFIDGLAAPLSIDAAKLRFVNSGLEVSALSGSIGKLPVSGTYSFVANARTTHRLRIAIAKASMGEVEQMLGPALTRSQGLIQRTLGNAPVVPDWLSARWADIDFEVGELAVSGYDLEGVRGRMEWRGKQIDVREFFGVSAKATVRGSASASLSGRQPVYRAEMRVTNADWHGGEVEADLQLSIANAIKLDATFAGRGVELGQEGEWRTINGAFSFQGGPGGLRVAFTGLDGVLGNEKFSGQGSSGPDGKFTIELGADKKQVRVAGKLAGLHLDFGAR